MPFSYSLFVFGFVSLAPQLHRAFAPMVLRVQELTKHCGATTTIDSEDGSGTRVRVTFRTGST